MSNDKNKQINVLADNFINPQQVKIIHDNLGLHLSEEHILTLKEWGKLFIEYNLHLATGEIRICPQCHRSRAMGSGLIGSTAVSQSWS